VGGWLATGAAFYPPGAGGLFVTPKLVGRFFTTSGGETGDLFGCTGADLANLEGYDAELALSLDAGYRWIWGPVYFSLIFGVGAGLCMNCLGDGPFFFGGFPFINRRHPRTIRLSVAPNPNLVRIGMVF
jgi:hypothetical protein